MIKSTVLHLLIIVLTTVVTYWLLPYGFFQQDEWGIFGNSIYRLLTHNNFLELIRPFSGFTHFTPITTIINITSLKIFGTQYQYYAYYAIVNQAINSILVYILARIVTKNTILSLLAGIVFSSYAISHQATTWLATNVGTEGSTFFLLLSLIFISRYIFEKRTMRNLFLSFVFFIISIGIKENTAFVIIFYSLVLFLVEKKNKVISVLKILSPFYILIFIYIFMRIVLSFSAPPTAGTEEQLSQPSPSVYIFRIFALPIRAISQAFIPEQYIIMLANGLIMTAYPQFLVDKKIPDPPIAQSVAVDIISFVLTVAILILGSVFYFRSKDKIKRRILVFSLLFITTSVLPLIFIPGRAGFFNIFESRELYLSSIGASITLALIITSLSGLIAKKISFLKGEYVVVFIIVAVFLFINMKTIRDHLHIINARGNVRKNILTQIINKYPNLTQKTVFYVESDVSFYGLPATEKIMPFQSGFGQTLLIWYFIKGEKFPACFFDYRYDFLYNIYSQGYKECEGRGFGYFRKLQDLKLAIKENTLPRDSVIGFRFDSHTNSLAEITNEIRSNL